MKDRQQPTGLYCRRKTPAHLAAAPSFSCDDTLRERPASQAGRQVLGRKRIILDREKIRTMHAAGDSVRTIGTKLNVSKSLVANIVKGLPATVRNDENDHVCDDDCRSYGCKQAPFFRRRAF